jgi:hypothetical protein
MRTVWLIFVVGCVAKGSNGGGGPSANHYSAPSTTRTMANRNRMVVGTGVAGGVYVYSSSGRSYSGASSRRNVPGRTTGSGDGKEENVFYCKNENQVSADFVCDFIDE